MGFRLSLAEACELLEDNPEIGFHRMHVTAIVQQQAIHVDVTEVTEDGEDGLWHFFIDAEMSDVDVWRRFGIATRNRTLGDLRLGNSVDANVMNENGEFLAGAARCIHTFFAEAKHNTCIKSALLDLTAGASMDDFGEFIKNNEALKYLEFVSAVPASLEQCTVLSRAIGSVHLKTVNTWDCCFENDGSFERFLEGFSQVDELQVACRRNSECTAIAALLRNPEKVLKELIMILKPGCLGAVGEQIARDICASLVGNTHLKSLTIEANKWWEMECFDCFDSENLLCHASSIESIANSNHTLQTISIKIAQSLSKVAQQCLVLNKNENKAKVIRDKVLRFYFVGEFDVSPFSNMAVSILSEVMSRIEGNDTQSAVFRLLQCIPELCNVSDRASS
jgi:hypothetical protein